eukprot:6877148-Pyramimonas_sp.AAC.2
MHGHRALRCTDLGELRRAARLRRTRQHSRGSRLRPPAERDQRRLAGTNRSAGMGTYPAQEPITLQG